MTLSLSDRVVEHLTALEPLAPLAEWRYEYHEEIGRGGMGVVYRAWDRELHRDVAVKVLHAVSRPGRAARLLQEARIVARLEHPGIVAVYDIGHTAEGLVACVMKLVRGERLDARIARGLDREEAFRIFSRVCETVAFAHAHGVIHRDLKPENVMLGAFGEVLILDWGLAKTGDARDGSTVTGTPGYMAPEQTAGRSDDADVRTDVYGLGGVLVAMFPLPERHRRLAAIIGRARAIGPEDRYPSVVGLADDVRRFAAGQSVSAYRDTLFDRARRLASRYREAILLVTAYLVIRALLLLLGGR